jgi:alpha-1,2-mannosyltransferase
VTGPAPTETPAWLDLAVAWLTPRRLRAQATVLALCLCGVCALDFSTPGFFDCEGNIKFQDFLPFYVSARLIAQDRAGELYSQQVTAEEINKIIHGAAHVRLPNLYGPQVGLVFVPLARLPFLTAAWVWVTLSMLVFIGCIYVVWRSCPKLRSYPGMAAISAFAFPPLFHFFVRGQISVLVLACFTAAFLAMRANRCWLAGIAMGCLVFKPQFLIAIPLVLLLAQAWKALAGAVISASAQMAFAWRYFGSAVMRAYFDTLWHISRWIGTAEPGVAHVQMHSLRSFWSLLIPWPEVALALYILSSIVAVVIAAAVWRSTSPLQLRFSALTLAAVLTNPHLFVYDLLVLAPVLLLLADWALANQQHHCLAAIRLLLYLAFVLPLLDWLLPWTHLRPSVPVLAALLWILWRHSARANRNPGSQTCLA